MIYISPHYVRVALKSAARKGLSSEQICTATGIELSALEQNDSSITTEQLCHLWQFLWNALDDEYLGFTKQPCKRGTFSLACKLACQTPSFKHLFREVNRICHLVGSDLILTAHTRKDQSTALQLQNHAPEYDIDHFITEYFLFYWHRLACWVSNQQIKPLRAEFTYPAPPHAHIYSELFQCPIVFEAEHNALIFHPNFLDIQPIRSRRELYGFLNRLPADFMSLPGEDSSLATQIKILILNESAHQLVFPPLEKLAERLNMSRTSLGRKLAAEHTSYRQLKELIRYDLTMEKLSLTSLNITDIAQQVGFSEPASLHRAFKQWSGMTPQQFRGKSSH